MALEIGLNKDNVLRLVSHLDLAIIFNCEIFLFIVIENGAKV